MDRSVDRDSAIHRVRKHLKRLRSLLRLVGPHLSEEGERALRAYRDIGRSLSPLRDARVVLDVHESLMERFGDQLKPAVAALVRQRLIFALQSAFAGRDADDRPRWDEEVLRERLRDARLALSDIRVAGDIDDIVVEGLMDTYRRGRHALKRANQSGHSEDLHALRKRGKDLWYQLEIVGGLWPRAAERIATVKSMTQLLGDAHDLVVYAETVSTVIDAENQSTIDVLAALADRVRCDLEDEAWDLATEVYDERPTDYIGGLAASWPLQRAAV
ncbi:MAG: CHAD domain-containing protein [Gammaproteobacteria bacterium]|nr:CHAD domain-containing protein [Gammaproteobacteria bacterium]